ncbi:MAG: hypothetical protein WC502_05210, partial [Methanolinea sp.]
MEFCEDLHYLGINKKNEHSRKKKFSPFYNNCPVVSRNHLTPCLYFDVSKLSNRDIRGIINQWKRRRPVQEIAD